MRTAAELAALALNPLPAEVTARVPVTPVRLRLAAPELVDSRVSKLTLLPKVPLVVMLIAPPVPVFEHSEMAKLPTAPPENPKPLLLLTVKPRRVFPLAR